MNAPTLKSKEKTGFTGIHKISICDVRHPKMKSLLEELKETMWRFDDGLLRARHDLNLLMARLPLPEKWSAFDREQVQMMRDVMNEIKRRKHVEVSQIYEAMRAVTPVLVKDIKNLLPTAGRTVVARWLIGDNTISADDGCNYGSLGTSATAPSNADTQLGTETYRKAISSVTYSSNVAYLSTFYTASEVTGTFQECGLHIAGTASANSGQLFSHFLTGGITKSSTETLTVESTITVS